MKAESHTSLTEGNLAHTLDSVSHPRGRVIDAARWLTADVLTPVQEKAVEYHVLGFSVGVQPFGAKSGYHWRSLQWVRLYHNPDDRRPDDLLSVTSNGNVNLCIITGRISGDLFILDCETRARLIETIEELRRRGVPLWVVQSPSVGGGGHVYLRSSGGEVENITTGVMCDLEVRGRNNYVLAPPSKHPTPASRNRVLYEWIYREGIEPPRVDPAIIDWLTTANGDPIALTTQAPKARGRRIVAVKSHEAHSKETSDYLVTGASLAEGSRNLRAFRAALDFGACALAGHDGYTLNDALRVLVPIATASGLSPHEARRAVENGYKTAKKPTPKRDQAAKIAYWQLAELYADSHEWNGRSGAGDHAVFRALILRAQSAANGRGVFRASFREIAELAHVNVRSVQKITARLQRRIPPLIERVETTDGSSYAALWRFSDHVIAQGRYEKPTLDVSLERLSSSVGFSSYGDLLEKRALGIRGIVIYRELLAHDGSLSLKELAKRAKCTEAQARYTVTKKLMPYGFAAVDTHERGRYYAIASSKDQLTTRITQATGAAGAGERRRERHEKERALHAGSLITRDRYRREHKK